MSATPSTPLTLYRRGDLVDLSVAGFEQVAYVLDAVRTMAGEMRYAVEYMAEGHPVPLIVRPEQIRGLRRPQ